MRRLSRPEKVAKGRRGARRLDRDGKISPMPVHSRHAARPARAQPVSDEALASIQLTLGHPAPRDTFPERPVDADVAASVIRDELMLDGNARLNLATFVTTWMEPQAEALMAECFDKNMIDKDEYPQTAERSEE